MSPTPAASRPPSMAWAIAGSVLLHAGLATALFGAHTAPPKARPPSYRVNLVAAPPSPPAAPVASPAAAPAPAPQPPPKKVVPKAAPVLKPAPTKAAPKAAKAAPPAAPPPPGTPDEHGTDVVNIRTEGIEFPFPAYLEHIVRVIAGGFKPDRNTAARAEVMFVIRRDGSVVPGSIQFITRSGNFAFDLEAQGAVEQAARVKAFGPLPDRFPDDVLPVVFSFDPRLFHQ